MGKEKPAPLKLRLKPADVARVGKVSFTPARFNTRHVSHSAGIERTIVTSTGNFVVTWNFRHVKKGKLQEYQVQRRLGSISLSWSVLPCTIADTDADQRVCSKYRDGPVYDGARRHRRGCNAFRRGAGEAQGGKYVRVALSTRVRREAGAGQALIVGVSFVVQ